MIQNGTDCMEIDSRNAYALLSGLEDVGILIHRSPDGDCIGGGYALHRILNAMGIRSRVICADPIPALYREITEDVTFEMFVPKCYVSVDVADRKLFGELPPEQKDAEILLCIDHHVSNTHYAKNLYWNPHSAAACEVLFRMMKENAIPMTRELALCLYIGIATDTGCFQFSNADADAFEAVAEIKRAYPELPYARLNRALFVLKSRGRIRLDAALMQDVQISESGKTALIFIPHALMQRFSLAPDEVDSVANLPMQIWGIEVGIVVKEQENGSYRISLRGGDHADVSVIAQQFGGGGHVKASGCSVSEGKPEDVCKRLMDVAEEMLKAWS